MSDELKACPFCGKDARASDDGDYCWCDGKINSCPGYVNSRVKKWNRRPLEDALRAKLDVAVEALKRIRGQYYELDDYHKEYQKIANKALQKLGEA